MKYLTLVVKVDENMKKPGRIAEAIDMLGSASVVASSWSDAIAERDKFKKLYEDLKNESN